MNVRPIGLALPEVAFEGEQFEICILGILDPATVRCSIFEAQSHLAIAVPELVVKKGQLCGFVTLSKAGIYRVEIHHADESPLTQLIMVVQSDTT